MGSLGIDISQGIATVTFNRPKTLNAITAEGKFLHTFKLASYLRQTITCCANPVVIFRL
jgi:hypothetical protein